MRGIWVILIQNMYVVEKLSVPRLGKISLDALSDCVLSVLLFFRRAEDEKQKTLR